MIGWDWVGIATHLSVEEFGSLSMASILLYGRYHARTHGWAHRFAHSYRTQFLVDFLLDLVVAIVTIQVLHL